MHSTFGFFLSFKRCDRIWFFRQHGLHRANWLFIISMLLPQVDGLAQGEYKPTTSPLTIEFTGRNKAEIEKVNTLERVLVGQREYDIQINLNRWSPGEEDGQKEVVQKHTASRWAINGKEGGWKLTKKWILPFDFHPEEQAQQWLDKDLNEERSRAAREWDRRLNDDSKKKQLKRLVKDWGNFQSREEREYYIKYRSYENGASEIANRLANTEEDLSKLFDEQVGQPGKIKKRRLQVVVKRLLELRSIKYVYDKLQGPNGIDEYLQDFFGSISNKTIVDKLKMIEAVHLCERGLVGNKFSPELTERFNTLSLKEKDAIADKLSVNLQVTFWPGRTASDPNSDPKYAQVINCNVDRVSRIEIYGLLNRGQGDFCDLWVLDNYSDAGMGFDPQPKGPGPQPKKKGVILKKGALNDGRTFIRILNSSEEQTIEYSVALDVNNKGKGKIKHYESPAPNNLIFPY